MMQSKYPIVLVHGMMTRDFLCFHFFGRIPKILKQNGLDVHIASHDSIGSIEGNAFQLKQYILKVIEKTGRSKVNIIAHSKGGLDARYMISKLDMKDYVASLTTLCTPHYGSKMSQKLLNMPRIIIKLLCFWVNLFYRITGDKKPNLYKLAEDLTVDKMVEFNKKILNMPGVYYQSYSSKYNAKKYNFIMGIPYKFSKFCENTETDCIVSVESAMWGDYQGHISEVDGFNHFEIIALGINKSRKKKIFEFYLSLASDLISLGY